MVTRENYEDVLKQIDAKTIKRMLRLQYVKEYAWLKLHTFNSGSFVTVKCTDIYKDFEDGNACLYLLELIDGMKGFGLIKLED